MSEKGLVKKEEVPRTKDEEKAEKTDAPKKPEKRKFFREGIEIKEDGVYFEVFNIYERCLMRY